MRYRIVCIIFILNISVNAQSWAPVGSGITGSDVNTTWALCTYDSVMFAGGYFDNAGGINTNNIAQWNGLQWDSLGSNVDGYINAMVVYNGRLYAGGEFETIGGIKCNSIASWNGNHWQSLGPGIKSSQYGIYCLAVYNGVLYAGGDFDSAGGKPIYGVAQWNDTAWALVGTGIITNDEDDGVFAMTVYDRELYVAGNFINAGGVLVSNIAKWNGSIWSDVAGGVNGNVYSLSVYNGDLYVGGMIDGASALPANCIAKWDGTNWSALGSGISGEAGWAIVSALTVYNGELYAGGFFDTVDNKPMNCITKWNGASWTPVGPGINIGGSIDAMTVYNNSLYIGGGFDTAGGLYAKNIAMYTNPSAINEMNDNNNLMVFPDPANNNLSVELNNFGNGILYTIYNELGMQVQSGKLNPDKITSIDISEFSSGLYIISVSDRKGKYNSKFIKN